MADEQITDLEEEKVVSSAELAETFGEEPSAGESATPESGDVQPEPDYDFEYTTSEGSVEKLTTSQMAERLANYKKLQSKLGLQGDEIGEYKRRIAEFEKAKTTSGASPQQIATPDYSDEDMEDPSIVKKILQDVLAQNANLAKQVESLPTIIEQKTEERETIREMQRVMASHPRLKNFKDERLKEAIVRNASVFGVAKNKETGQVIYNDLDSAVDGFFTLMRGGVEPVTQQAFVRNLKSPQNEVLPAGGGRPIGDVVKRYGQLKSPDERANFLSTLSDEEVKLIDSAVYAGEV